jgi:hypothetical protein
MRIRWTEPPPATSPTFAITPRNMTARKQLAGSRCGIYDGVGALMKFPYRCRPGRKPGTRELVFSGLPFLVVYRVRDDVIEINRILHGAQTWPEPKAAAPKNSRARPGNHLWPVRFTYSATMGVIDGCNRIVDAFSDERFGAKRKKLSSDERIAWSSLPFAINLTREMRAIRPLRGYRKRYPDLSSQR